VFEIEVVDHIHRFALVPQREKTVGGEEEVGLEPVEEGGKAVLKPGIIEKGVAGRRELDQWRDVIREKKLLRKVPVKDEVKMVFRVLGGDPFQ